MWLNNDDFSHTIRSGYCVRWNKPPALCGPHRPYGAVEAVERNDFKDVVDNSGKRPGSLY